MKRRLKTWEAIAIQVVFVTAVMGLASCAEANRELTEQEDVVPTPVELAKSVTTLYGALPYSEFVRIEDEDRGVVCYAYRGNGSIAIDCMPTLQLRY